jgi:mRNA-degrading endonuclease RelE of RelBE toxin-antitoxin system
VYRITYSWSVADDLKRLPAHLRSGILDQIEVQLRHEPTRQTRNRKIIVGLIPSWGPVEPVWELRIGHHRVFYDVDDEEQTVTIRAIRHKPPQKTTEEIL